MSGVSVGAVNAGWFPTDPERRPRGTGVNPEPVIVTDVPTTPQTGVNDVIVAADGRKSRHERRRPRRARALTRLRGPIPSSSGTSYGLLLSGSQGKLLGATSPVLTTVARPMSGAMCSNPIPLIHSFSQPTLGQCLHEGKQMMLV